MEYLVVVEKGPGSYGAYVPDLPGCVAVARSRSEVLKLIREAIVLHIEGLHEDGQRVPEPSSSSALVNVKAAETPADYVVAKKRTPRVAGKSSRKRA